MLWTADIRCLVSGQPAGGNLRRWRTFMKMTNLDPVKADQPVSVDEIKAFLIRQGHTLKNAGLS